MVDIENKKLEDWNKWLKLRYNFPDEYELINKKVIVKKNYLRGLTTGFFIMIGLLAIAGVIFYATYYGDFKDTFICGNTTCEGDSLNCPSCPQCPANNCNPSFTCKVPDEIKIINGSG